MDTLNSDVESAICVVSLFTFGSPCLNVVLVIFDVRSEIWSQHEEGSHHRFALVSVKYAKLRMREFFPESVVVHPQVPVGYCGAVVNAGFASLSDKFFPRGILL